jgi:predicted 3-demethylubiquinone-9 3-methyltransferase (glyoxalase superfamily)
MHLPGNAVTRRESAPTKHFLPPLPYEYAALEPSIDARTMMLPKAREDARDARAEATFNVAKQKCDALAGNPKDVCVKEADAALVKAKADAKVDRVTADTRQEAATKQADALKRANADKHDADYKVAIEKCDALAAPAKDACISNATVQYGKS